LATNETVRYKSTVFVTRCTVNISTRVWSVDSNIKSCTLSCSVIQHQPSDTPQ